MVNVENYQPGNDLYWEVAVLDPEGYIWQYHHIDKNTIPQAIKDAFAEYKANPTTGRLHRPEHLHRQHRLLDGGYVRLPLQPHPPEHPGGWRGVHQRHGISPAADRHGRSRDSSTIGLLKNNTVTAGNTVSGDYGLYVRAK